MRIPLIVLALALAACTRSVPSEHPRGSSASLDSPESAPALVGLAIAEEPPLPGEERPGWDALATEEAGADPHQGHHGHGGHGHAH